MPRKLKVEVTAPQGGVDECVVWVNHTLVGDSALALTWEGKIPSARTPLTIETTGQAGAWYHVSITIDGQGSVAIDRTLDGGADEFHDSV